MTDQVVNPGEMHAVTLLGELVERIHGASLPLFVPGETLRDVLDGLTSSYPGLAVLEMACKLPTYKEANVDINGIPGVLQECLDDVLPAGSEITLSWEDDEMPEPDD